MADVFSGAKHKAIDRLATEMLKRLPDHENDCGDEVFDPWVLFPSLYGSYSGEFDQCAIEVLIEIYEGRKRRDDLAAEMFREMLCTSGLCDYGTSPRVCFATIQFMPHLADLIGKWKACSLVRWGQDVCDDKERN